MKKAKLTRLQKEQQEERRVLLDDKGVVPSTGDFAGPPKVMTMQTRLPKQLAMHVVEMSGVEMLSTSAWIRRLIFHDWQRMKRLPISKVYRHLTKPRFEEGIDDPRSKKDFP